MMERQRRPQNTFEAFAQSVEPRLRMALVATYGPVDGRAVTVDALSWAWEHWTQVQAMTNPVAYLYRVGQSASRRYATKPLPAELMIAVEARFPEVVPELLPALGRLSGQQRTVVMLVHAFGWTLRDAAELLDISPSTVREHLDRAITRLRADLEVHDDH